VDRSWLNLIKVRRFISAALLITSFSISAKPWTPTQDDVVLEVLPKTFFTQKTVFDKKQKSLIPLATNPTLAAKKAAQLITLGRQQSDPRYFGHAQAEIQPWWNLINPPDDILLIRATLKQNQHQYLDAIQDLEKLTQRSPKNSQAWLTLGTIQMIQGDYSQAKQSCAALARSHVSWLATLCFGQVMALTGKAEQGYNIIHLLLKQHADSDSTDKDLINQQWLHTLLAEISLRQGKKSQAVSHFKFALSIPQRDPYLLKVYSEFLRSNGEAIKVLSLLEKETQDDALLLELVLAAKQTKNKQRLDIYRHEFNERLLAAQMRGDTLHQREHATFLLEIVKDKKRALALAKNNWRIQKEPADMRLLLAAAISNGDHQTTTEIIQWKNTQKLQDSQLQMMLSKVSEVDF
jgi:tetratricopeptide (TPR) repeat protein